MNGLLLIGHGTQDKNSPYLKGVQKIAKALSFKLKTHVVKVAYNEFCSPTILEAIEGFIDEKISQIDVITTMITPGGSHSEKDIPETLNVIRNKHPDIIINYLWPYDIDEIASFFRHHIETQAN